MKRALIGNTFPTALIRKPVLIKPVINIDLLSKMSLVSYWGHSESIEAVREQFGIDVTPEQDRPVLKIDDETGCPELDGEIFTCVIVLSPRFAGNFRPPKGEKILGQQVESWQCLEYQF